MVTLIFFGISRQLDKDTNVHFFFSLKSLFLITWQMADSCTPYPSPVQEEEPALVSGIYLKLLRTEIFLPSYVYPLTYSSFCPQRPTPPLPPALEEDEVEKSCGPTGFWEALTPCNGCRNLGFAGLQVGRRNTNTLFNRAAVCHNQHLMLLLQDACSRTLITTSAWLYCQGESWMHQIRKMQHKHMHTSHISCLDTVKLQASGAAIVLSEYLHWLPWEHNEWAINWATGCSGSSGYSARYPSLSGSRAWLCLFFIFCFLTLDGNSFEILFFVFLFFACTYDQDVVQ